MLFSRLLKFASHDMAIDLGTVNTVGYLRDKGIVLNEASVVALETIDGVKRVKVVGNDAQLMMGKTPARSEEHTSELQSLMRISYAVFCLKKKITCTAALAPPHRAGLPPDASHYKDIS